MSENYSDDDASGAAGGAANARELIARLLRGVDVELVVSALAAEGVRAPRRERALPGEPALDPAARELRRVRHQFALGDAAIALRHDLNNPLTALLAEAQLLEMEPLGEEHRAAVRRIVDLTRRIAAAARHLDTGEATTIG